MSHRLCSPFVDGQDNVLLLARLLARGAVMLLNLVVEKPCEPEHRKKVLSVLHFLFSKETRLCVKSVMVKCGSVLSTFPYWEASSSKPGESQPGFLPAAWRNVLAFLFDWVLWHSSHPNFNQQLWITHL